MPNNRIGYQHINIVNIVPSAAMHTPLSIWVNHVMSRVRRALPVWPHKMG